MWKVSRYPLLVFFLAFLFLAFVPLAHADGGLIPWPSEISLRESGQKAIIAWNGTEEVLILSTDVMSSESATVLRFVPLPSNPTKVEEGTFSSFENLVEIINQKIRALGQYERSSVPTAGPEGGLPSVEITFHALLGPHDVTIVKVNDLEYFMTWVENFASSKGLAARAIPDGFKQSVASYLDNEIAYFVFDVTQTGSDEKSVTPLVYRFETDYIYYPLNITGNSVGLESTWDEIQLFILTKGRISGGTVENFQLQAGIGFEEWLELSLEELTQVSPEIADLFGSDPFVMRASYRGQLSELGKDLKITGGEIHIPSTLDRLSHGFSEYFERNYFFTCIREILEYISSEYPVYYGYGYLGWALLVPLLGALLCGIPTSVILIAKLSGKIAKKITRRKLGTKERYTIAGLIVLLLITCSNIMVVALFAIFLFTVIGIVGIVLMLKWLIKFLEH